MKAYTLTVLLPDGAPAKMIEELERCLTRPSYVLNFGGCQRHHVSVFSLSEKEPSGDLADDGELYRCAYQSAAACTEALEESALIRCRDSTASSGDQIPMQH